MLKESSKNVVSFNRNGRNNGDICISAPGFQDPENRYEIKVEFDDLKSFVCSVIRQKRIEKIEKMTNDELLGF